MSTKPSIPVESQPITRGNVVAAFLEDMMMAMSELTARRQLGEDLAAWFAMYPDAGEDFGAFQAGRQATRQRKKPAKRRS